MSAKALIRVLALSLAAAANVHAAELQTIRIAADVYPPYMAVKPDGTMHGFDIDLFADVCRRMNVRCQWVRQSFDGIIPALQRGRFDAICNALTITDERLKVIDFSVPYNQGPNGFMTLENSAYEKRLSFKGTVNLGAPSAAERKLIADTKRAIEGATVGILRGSTYEKFVKATFADTVRIKTYETKEEAFFDLVSGRIDLMAGGIGEIDENFMKEQEKAGHKLVAVGPYFKGGVLGRGVGVALRKGNDELRRRFDQALIEANRDGTIKKLGLKWFGFDGSPPLPATAPPST